MKAFWEILRPFNCLMASAAAMIGLALAGGIEPEPALLIFVIVFLVTGAGNAINDYYDKDIQCEESFDRSGEIDKMLTEMIEEELLEEKARAVGFVEVALTPGGIATAEKLKKE